MTAEYAQRLTRVPQSFIREILQVTLDPSVISFAGGLPNAATFPVTELAEATQKVYQSQGKGALQYSTTRGLPELRQHIATDLKQRSGLDVTADDILITSGSQQGLDLIGKVFLNRDDPVAMERPGYLGAIQALSVYEPNLMAIPLDEQGLEVQALDLMLNHAAPKLLYTVPSYQNPSGISYSEARRREVADRLKNEDIVLIEDDPYGQLRYDGDEPTLLKSLLPDKTVLLGSFSKTVAPGLRLGWICAERDILDKLALVKQATDLHTSTLNQQILLQYLTDNNLDSHLQQVKAVYRQQRDTMIDALECYFPKDVHFTRPQGGMFLWITLPQGVSSLELFGLAIKEKVAFVPGTPFYVDGGGENCLRLNFSNADPNRIDQGIRILSECLVRIGQDGNTTTELY